MKRKYYPAPTLEEHETWLEYFLRYCFPRQMGRKAEGPVVEEENIVLFEDPLLRRGEVNENFSGIITIKG